MQWSQLSVGWCDFQVPLHSDAIRYGWDGIASDSQVELVNQPPTCRQLRKGKSLGVWRNSWKKMESLSSIVSKVEQCHVFFVESFMFPFACRNLAPGSFFSHRKHWITLCVFQQINSEQRLRCQPHQRDQSSQRFVDTLHIGIQPMTNWLPTSWWFRLCRKNPFHKPSKTAKTKQKQHHPQTPHEPTTNQQHFTCRNVYTCHTYNIYIWHMFQTNPWMSSPPHRYVSPHENAGFFPPHLHSPHNLASLNLANLAGVLGDRGIRNVAALTVT